MGDCNDSKYGCGAIIPSSCVPYTGKDLTFVNEDDQLSCDANIDDVFFKIDAALKILVEGNDLTELDKDCLTFDPLIITPKGLHQIEITEICLLKGRTDSLEEQLENLNIGVEIITITLPTCLQPLAALCSVGENQYQLLNLLILFANKLCDYETRISDLES